MVSSARPEEMEFPTWRRAPDDGLIAAVRQHAHTRRSSVGVCDSEVMFVASCRLIQGAIRVKVHRIDVHMRQRPVSLSFPPPFFPFSRAESRSTVSPRPGLRPFREPSPNFFHLPLEGREARSPISQKCARYSRRIVNKNKVSREITTRHVFTIFKMSRLQS